MYFTREPTILSVITPREGCKLVLRNANIKGQEDFFVDSVEVISFEGSVFYRSSERPKSFVLPVNSYEVLEVKETRMVLKSATSEKSIKIGGGTSKPRTSNKGRGEKEDKKHTKKRKPSPEPTKEKPKDQKEEERVKNKTPVAPPAPKKLFPPPNVLIKEKLVRVKDEKFFDENILPAAEESEGKLSKDKLPEKQKDAEAKVEAKEETKADEKLNSDKNEKKAKKSEK